MSSLWQEAYEVAEEFGGGSGGGIIAEATVHNGLWVYVSGLSGEARSQCMFSIPKGGNRQAIYDKAVQFAGEYGKAKKDVTPAIILEIFKERNGHEAFDAATGDAKSTWQGNRYEVAPTWTLKADGPSQAKLLVEKMEALGIAPGMNIIARFAWVPDPYKESLGDVGKTKQKDDGTLDYPYILIPVQVYASWDEALANVGSDEPVNTNYPPVPDAWSALEVSSWVEQVKKIKLQIGDAPALPVVAKAAQDAACSPDELKAWLAAV